MPSDNTDPDHETVEQIIERITIDAYGDEGHTSFLCAFEDEVEYPIPASLAGLAVSLDQVGYEGDPARGLVGSITNPTGQHCVALIELDLTGHARRLLNAYRRWLGLTTASEIPTSEPGRGNPCQLRSGELKHVPDSDEHGVLDHEDHSDRPSAGGDTPVLGCEVPTLLSGVAGSRDNADSKCCRR